MYNENEIKINKSIPYYELPLIIETNLSDEILEWINNNYDFLVYNIPVFNIFYINNGQINYKNYISVTEEFYNFKEGLDNIINKYNIIRDKKICLIIDITQKPNYYRIRYVYIDIENIYLKCDKSIKTIIRKEKIKILLNDDSKKSFKQFIEFIKNNNILTEEIGTLHI